MEKEIVEMKMVGDYIACSNGRIFKLNWHNTGRTREIKQTKRHDGYLHFRFNEKKVMSHRFIATCFIPNPDNLPEVNHKNEIKTDNHVENLEWCDRKYNNNYGTRKERVSRSMVNHPDKSKPVSKFTKDGEFVTTYPSIMEAGRQTGVVFCHISACCLGKRKSAGGFIWRYAY